MYQATHEVPSASAQEPVSHHHVMWLVKEWYYGAFWYQEAINFREQLEKQYMNGIGIAHGELMWKRENNSETIHYYTHDFTTSPWTQTRFWDEDRVEVKHAKDIVRVLQIGTRASSI